MFTRTIMVALLLVCSEGALAQNMSSPQPPNAPVNNCAGDRQKYCGMVKPGGGRIIDCLQSHKAQLTQACRTQMGPMFDMRQRQKQSGMSTAPAATQPGSKPPG